MLHTGRVDCDIGALESAVISGLVDDPQILADVKIQGHRHSSIMDYPEDKW